MAFFNQGAGSYAASRGKVRRLPKRARPAGFSTTLPHPPAQVALLGDDGVAGGEALPVAGAPAFVRGHCVEAVGDLRGLDGLGVSRSFHLETAGRSPFTVSRKASTVGPGMRPVS